MWSVTLTMAPNHKVSKLVSSVTSQNVCREKDLWEKHANTQHISIVWLHRRVKHRFVPQIIDRVDDIMSWSDQNTADETTVTIDLHQDVHMLRLSFNTSVTTVQHQHMIQWRNDPLSYQRIASNHHQFSDRLLCSSVNVEVWDCRLKSIKIP